MAFRAVSPNAIGIPPSRPTDRCPDPQFLYQAAVSRPEMAGEPGFEIPARPVRRFSSTGDLAYEGGTRFELTPDPTPDGSLADLVEMVLDAGPYRYGDFLELPMPLYLVRDDETGDVFRVAVRDGSVRLHVLPDTEPAGLRAFYDRLSSATDSSWAVSRFVEG